MGGAHFRGSTYKLLPALFRQGEVVPFFEVLEKEESVAEMVMDYSISQTTLEEVFLNVNWRFGLNYSRTF